MRENIRNQLSSLKILKNQEIEALLVETYRHLDSSSSIDYNLCLSVICHVANLNSSDSMIQQLLHDCIVKSRIFLYDSLLKKNNDTYNPLASVSDSLLCSVYTSRTTETVLTRPQKEIFDEFQKFRRLIVSAPTSFGKTRIIREIISHNNYKNIALIMPTVSLLSEQYQDLRENIAGYTLSKSSKVKIKAEEKYILVLTPERMSAFLEENPDFEVDFFVMDEIYKIDYKLEDDRFRVFSDILYQLAKTRADFYLIGPYISGFSKKFIDTFGASMKKYDLEVVQKDFYYLDNEDSRGVHDIEKGKVRIIKNKFENLLRLVSEETIDGKYLIYRYQKQYVESSAKKFIEKWPVKPHNTELVDYLCETVSSDWDLIPCIKRGVAFHHGAMPRHVQDLIVDEFNDAEASGVNYLFCTTSLTEGINSSAKNVVLYDNKIGNGGLLKTLDRKNIEGRAGRFMRHFIGRVFYLEEPKHVDSETVVEVEYFDNKDPAIESLIQLEDGDIPSDSLAKVKAHLDLLKELGIPSELFRTNKFVSIDGQVELLKKLRSLKNLSAYQFEGKIPGKDNLEEVLSDIYDFLFSSHEVGRNFNTEVGKSILISLTKYYAYHKPPFKLLLEHDAVVKARTTDNARIRYVFDLMSKYFEFVWPRYLKAFEAIHNFVANETGENNIDLSFLIATLEYGTTESHEIILRDSGIPREIIKKISRHFSKCESFDDIQSLYSKSRVDINRSLHPIEIKVLNKYI